MVTPKLTPDEYSAVVTDWNRRVRRGMVEPCPRHQWARIPSDTDDCPQMICVHCMRPYRVDEDRHVRPDPRMARPPGRGGMPM